MPRFLLRLRPVALAVTLALLLPGTASASGDAKPAPPTGGHDVTKPWITSQVSDQVAAASVGPQQPRGSVIPLRPKTRAATAGSAAPASPVLNREVMGFASATSLDDANVGFRTWNFGLLSDVAYFGIHVNTDGSLVNDSGLQVWQSATASNLINAAHAAGARVLLTLMFLPTAANNATTCQALADASTTTTINQVMPLVQGIADGIDIDYEASNTQCPDGQSLRAKLPAFVQKVRSKNLGHLVVDTFASSAEDTGGFFDVPTLAGTVDALFVMAYGLETSNGPCALCMGPTSPFDGAAPNYTWNVTRAANDYAPWASKTIMGLPYYGVAGCVNGPNPPANAPVLSPGAQYAGVPYTTFSTLPSDPSVSSFQAHRDALDPGGQERWASYFNSSLNCWREAYWDDQLSLVRKYDLVNQRGFQGAGIFTLDFGGGSPELWNALALEFGSAPTVQSLGAIAATAPAVASWGTNRLDVFVVGLDSALWHDAWDGTSWSGWQSLGGLVTSAPAAVSWGPNRIDVFVRGGTDSSLWHLAWNGSGWAWEGLGGYLTSAPAVSSWAANRLDVFVRASDNALWHKAWDGSAWGGWQGLGGLLSSAPGAVSPGPNRADVFVRANDNSLWHLTWNGSTGTWEGLGGILVDSPAAASTGSGLIDVLVPGIEGLWRRSWNGSAWGDYTSVGPITVWHFGPAAVSQAGSGHLDVFAAGPDDAVWHFVI
ncbi:MAG TPA: glycosyl hydrolase family 18 protein [Terriglobales bacterium]|nr:glycosyl hydrolase family 18 protein [Terriglobales bacterium]